MTRLMNGTPNLFFFLVLYLKRETREPFSLFFTRAVLTTVLFYLYFPYFDEVFFQINLCIWPFCPSNQTNRLSVVGFRLVCVFSFFCCRCLFRWRQFYKFANQQHSWIFGGRFIVCQISFTICRMNGWFKCVWRRIAPTCR